MKIKVISYGKNRDTAEVVLIVNGTSVTRHLKLNYGVWMDKFATHYKL